MAEPGLKRASVVLHRLPLDWRTKYREPGLSCLKTEPDSQDFNYIGSSKVWSSGAEQMSSMSHLDTDHIKTEPDVEDSIKLEPPFLQPCGSTKCKEEIDEVRIGSCSQLQGHGFMKTDVNEVNNNLKTDVMTTQCVSSAVNITDIPTDESESQPSVTVGVPHNGQQQKHNLYRKDLKGQRNHQRIYMVEKLYSCDRCGKKFSYASNAMRHQLLHFSKEYACGECGKSFHASKDLKKHQRIHSGEKPYSCSECGKRFAQGAHLKAHQRVHAGEKPYSCTECEKRFAQRSHLKRHWSVHTDEKPCICTECGKKFRSPCNLSRHQLIHFSTDFVCRKCGKSFVGVSGLKLHERLHSGEKPYGCSECGKSFAQVSHLNRHQRVHSGEKPYSCTECGKKFSCSSSFKCHQLIHASKKYVCGECGKSFSHKGAFKNHKRSHTNKRS